MQRRFLQKHYARVCYFIREWTLRILYVANSKKLHASYI